MNASPSNIVDAVIINGVNGFFIAVIKLSDVKDITAIGVGLVSMICTVLLTWYKMRSPKKEKTDVPIRHK